MKVDYEVGFFGSLFRGNGVDKVRLVNDCLIVNPDQPAYGADTQAESIQAFSSGKSYRFDLDTFVDRVTKKAGNHWASLTLSRTNGTTITLNGLPVATAHTLSKSFSDQLGRRKKSREILCKWPSLVALHGQCAIFFNRKDRISSTEVIEVTESVSESIVPEDYETTLLNASQVATLRDIKNFRVKLKDNIENHNFDITCKENLLRVELSADKIAQARALLDDLSKAFVRSLMMKPLLSQLHGDREFWTLSLPTEVPGEGPADDFLTLRSFMSHPEGWRSRHNDRYVEAALDRTDEFFGAISGGLTRDQRRACVVDETRMRIVAGAGSGKTTTLFAKAAYLVEMCDVEANRILAVTYSRKSSRDLKERFDARSSLSDVEISTIHRLGLRVQAVSANRKPDIARWLDDEVLFSSVIQEFIEDGLKQADVGDAVRAAILYNEQELVPPFAFKSREQYLDYIIHVKPLSLRGDTLSSHQECLIANFLFEKGVRYEYEWPYEIEVSDAQHRQYRPDFFLPDYDLYIEHYGISRSGETRGDIDAAEYRASMEWKRELHAAKGTKCIETFSYEATEGTLLEGLDARLREGGVAYNPLPVDELLELLQKTGRVTAFDRFVRQFIPLYKERQVTDLGIAELYQRNAFEKSALAPALEYLFGRYEGKLHVDRAVDFSDMLLDAIKQLESGTVVCPYDIILLDESQDLSFARAQLVKRFVQTGSDTRLSAVGDDWQSIYRFSGSDLKLFTGFEDFFGSAATIELPHTHRFDEAIAAPTSKFIRRNPSQTQRDVISNSIVRRHEAGFCVVTSSFRTTDAHADNGLAVLDAMWGVEGRSVLIIGRLNSDAPTNLTSLRLRYLPKTLSFTTAHSSKGLEADFVVVLRAQEGWNGFPSVRAGDSLLERLLAPAEPFEAAEDRRLFYVAATRARFGVAFCCDEGAETPFILELMGSSPEIATFSVENEIAAVDTRVLCRSCGHGFYIVKDGKFGQFVGCSDFPICRETTEPCSECGSGILERKEGKLFCTGADCRFEGEVCPKCDRGWLKQKLGTNGPFLGCSRWRRNRAGCSYTRS